MLSNYIREVRVVVLTFVAVIEVSQTRARTGANKIAGR